MSEKRVVIISVSPDFKLEIRKMYGTQDLYVVEAVKYGKEKDRILTTRTNFNRLRSLANVLYAFFKDEQKIYEEQAKKQKESFESAKEVYIEG